MSDYEERILNAQESEIDECASCSHKGKNCRNQCMKEEKIYNPVLNRFFIIK